MAPRTLDKLYLHLHEQARRSGQDRSLNLSGGARFAVRVRDGTTTVTISRAAKPLGDREVIVFKGIFNIPDTATRIPADGQGERDGQHYVAWRFPTPGGSHDPHS